MVYILWFLAFLVKFLQFGGFHALELTFSILLDGYIFLLIVDK